MLALYFHCRCCGTGLRLPHHGVRPLVSCPKCMALFRVPIFGDVRFGTRKAEHKTRTEMFWSVQRN